MPGSVSNNQCSCPSQACQANQKAEAGQTKLCSCPSEQNGTLPGASKEDRGSGCTLNGPLCCPRKTFRITQHPIVSQVTPLHTHPPLIPTNHSFTFKPPIPFSFIHSLPLLAGETCLYSLRGEEKTHPTINGWNSFRISTRPLSSQQKTPSRADPTCHSCLTGS